MQYANDVITLIYTTLGIVIILGGAIVFLVRQHIKARETSRKVTHMETKMAESLKAHDDIKNDLNQATRSWEAKLNASRDDQERYRFEQAKKCGEHSAKLQLLEMASDSTIKTLDELKTEFRDGMSDIKDEISGLRGEIIDIFKDGRK